MSEINPADTATAERVCKQTKPEIKQWLARELGEQRRRQEQLLRSLRDVEVRAKRAEERLKLLAPVAEAVDKVAALLANGRPPNGQQDARQMTLFPKLPKNEDDFAEFTVETAIEDIAYKFEAICESLREAASEFADENERLHRVAAALGVDWPRDAWRYE